MVRGRKQNNNGQKANVKPNGQQRMALVRQPRPRPAQVGQILRRYVDPWDGKGVKWPDSNSTSSSTLTTYTLFQIEPVGGRAAARIYPGLLHDSYYPAPTLTAGAFPVSTWGTASNCANYTNIAANSQGVRIVSAGVRARYVGNDYNNAGTLIVRESMRDSHGSTAGPLDPDDFTQVYHMGRYKDGFKWVARKTSVEADMYHKPVDEIYDSWPTLTIFVRGADSTVPQMMEVEIVQNIEYLPLAGTILAQSTTPAALDMPNMRASIANKLSTMNPFQ
jgi:hypothetical protein